MPWLALSVLGGHTSNAASEGCHSIAQLQVIMSDLQTSESMGDDIVQMTASVCLRDRDGKEAVEQLNLNLKAIYPDRDDSEAKNAELDITGTAKFKS